MTEETKKKLKLIKRRVCSICNRKSSYTNPIARCFQCQKDFCYDHIIGGQVNDQMGENDRIRDICKSCKKKHGYRSV